MSEPTFCCPDLDEFCLLDRLGRTVAGQRVADDHTVLSCRIVESDDVTERDSWGRRCGAESVPRDSTGPGTRCGSGKLSVVVDVVSASALREVAAQLVGGLREEGVRPGDWVAFSQPNSADLLAAVHGCLLAGTAPMVLSSQLTEREQADLLAETPARLVGRLHRGEPVTLGSSFRCCPVHVTSGTTGRPKPVWSGWLDPQASRALAEEERATWRFRPDDIHLVVAPLSHSAPLPFALNTVLFGGSVAVLPAFDPAVVVEAVERIRPTTTFMAPMHLQRLLFDVKPPRMIYLHLG